MLTAAVLPGLIGFIAVWILLAVVFGMIWHSIKDNDRPRNP